MGFIGFPICCLKCCCFPSHLKIILTKNTASPHEDVITLSHSHTPTRCVRAALHLIFPIWILFLLLSPSALALIYAGEGALSPLCLSLLSFFFRPNECGLGAFNELYGELTPQSTHTHTTCRYGGLPVQANTPTAVHIHFNSSLPPPLCSWSSHNALCPSIPAAPPCSGQRRCSSPCVCVCEAESCRGASWLQSLRYSSGANGPVPGCLEGAAHATRFTGNTEPSVSSFSSTHWSQLS